VVASNYMRSVAVRNGVDPGRCVVAPYFAERPAAPPPASSEAVVAFLGRISYNKGLDTLLRSLALLRGHWDRLLVAGDGWALPECRRLANRLGVDSKVSFLGWCGREVIAEVCEAARVVVVPSRWPEPFGIVGIEAMAHARPVVASRVGGIPEWLDDGETGLLVKAGSEGSLASALGALLSDPGRAEAMGREAWERAQRFSLERHLERLDGLYESALSARIERSERSGLSLSETLDG
jgi:glycosyltransferase involved in cell wall biosynthesis